MMSCQVVDNHIAVGTVNLMGNDPSSEWFYRVLLSKDALKILWLIFSPVQVHVKKKSHIGPRIRNIKEGDRFKRPIWISRP